MPTNQRTPTPKAFTQQELRYFQNTMQLICPYDHYMLDVQLLEESGGMGGNPTRVSCSKCGRAGIIYV